MDLPPKWRWLFGKAAGPLHSRGGHCSGATLYRVRDLDPRHVSQRAYFCCHKTPAAAIDLGLGCSNQIAAPPFWGQVGLGRTLGDMDGGRDQGVPVEGRRLHQLQEGSVELTILTTLYGTFKRTRLQARDQRSRRAWRAFQSMQIAFTADSAVWKQEHPNAKATTRMKAVPPHKALKQIWLCETQECRARGNEAQETVDSHRADTADQQQQQQQQASNSSSSSAHIGGAGRSRCTLSPGWRR